MSNNIQLNKELLHILQISDILYSRSALMITLSKKLKKKGLSKYYISIELQTFLHAPYNHINLYTLMDIIIKNYTNNINYPNYDYYSYDQKPNYNLL